MQALGALGALAQESRLRVFRRLVQAGSDGRAPGELAHELGLPAPTLSFHLAQLKGAGLVSVQREGRGLRYAADYAAMRDLVAYLLENCCGVTAAGAGRSAPACAPTPPSREVRAKDTSRRARGGRHEASSRPRRRR